MSRLPLSSRKRQQVNQSNPTYSPLREAEGGGGGERGAFEKFKRIDEQSKTDRWKDIMSFHFYSLHLSIIRKRFHTGTKLHLVQLPQTDKGTHLPSWVSPGGCICADSRERALASSSCRWTVCGWEGARTPTNWPYLCVWQCTAQYINVYVT